jgi:hypothetical protein
MKLIRVEVLPARDNDVVSAVIIEQRCDGGVWREVARHDEVVGSRTLLLEDNERIIVDGQTQVELVVDKEQNAVMTRPLARVGLTTNRDSPYVQDALTEGPMPGALPPGTESQIGVWDEVGERPYSRTGKRYRIY